MRVLIVEDERALCDTLAKSLKRNRNRIGEGYLIGGTEE